MNYLFLDNFEKKIIDSITTLHEKYRYDLNTGFHLSAMNENILQRNCKLWNFYMYILAIQVFLR